MAICRRVGLSRGVPMDCPSQVLEEFRVMDVAANTHAFLHGLETTVPGSYLKGQLLCGNMNCRGLEQKWQLLKQKGVHPGNNAEAWNVQCARWNVRVGAESCRRGPLVRTCWGTLLWMQHWRWKASRRLRV